MVVYCDGAEHTDPSTAPIRPVACIVQGEHQVLRGRDYYYFHRGRWWGTDNPASALCHHSLGEPLLHGGFMDTDEYDRLIDRHLHR